MTTKICLKCKKIKPISEFYKNKHCEDGHLNDCKTCQKIYVAKYQKTAKGKVTHRKGTKKYQNTEKGKASQKHFKQSENGKASHQTSKKRFNIRNPNQLKAQQTVNDAIKKGKLPRPDTLICHYCPEQAKQYHHWHGYEPEHWLDVVPICMECHIKYKRKIA